MAEIVKKKWKKVVSILFYGICKPSANNWGKCFVFVWDSINSIIYQRRIVKSVYSV